MSFSHYTWIWIVAFVLLLAFVLWRRGRRMIGRQRFSERRTRMRSILFLIFTALLAWIYVRHGYPAVFYLSLVVGFVVGAIIAAFALRFTRMGRDERGVWYTPNIYLGTGLIVLLVGRYVYEYFVILPRVQERMQTAAQGVQHTPVLYHPVLYGLLFVVLGYYVVYYGGLLYKVKRVGSAEPAERS